MGTLSAWSMFTILCQTFFSVMISWIILSCKLEPESTELYEITLIKLLYLYDPKACARIHFYNFVTKTKNSEKEYNSSIVWPEENEIATSFRKKIKVWVSLHIIWSTLGIVNISRGNRPCDFYVILIPFTLIGVTLLSVDVIFASLFLLDAKNTQTEMAILYYVDANKNYVRTVNSTINQMVDPENSSWIGVLMAYCSIRFVVLWILNFWIVKDTYFDGLAVYHKQQYVGYMGKVRSLTNMDSHMDV